MISRHIDSDGRGLRISIDPHNGVNGVHGNRRLQNRDPGSLSGGHLDRTDGVPQAVIAVAFQLNRNGPRRRHASILNLKPVFDHPMRRRLHCGDRRAERNILYGNIPVIGRERILVERLTGKQ